MPVDVVGAVHAHLTAKRDRQGLRQRSRTNNASELGDACLRKLVYKRVRPEDAAAVSPELMAIFEWGNAAETYITRLLSDAGIQVTHAQMSARWEQYNISGHIDGYIQDPETGEMIVVEIKSLNPFDWERIKSPADMAEGWTARYLAQLVLYLWLEERETGMFILFNKSAAAFKTITIKRDDYIDLAETLLQRAQAIEEHVFDYRHDIEGMSLEYAESRLPERINTRSECERCPFFTICNPVLEYGPEVEVIEDARLASLMVRHEALDSARREFEALDKEIKDKFNLPMGVTAGDWLVSAPDGSDTFAVTARRDKRDAVRKSWRRPAMLGAGTGEGGES